MKNYYELVVSVYLNKNIHVSEVQEKISNIINYSMKMTPLLRDIHLGKGFKHYSFSSLYRYEKDGIYKEDNIYIFKIRTFNKNIRDELVKALDGISNEDFTVQMVEKREKESLSRINSLECVTPFILTMKSKDDSKKSLYWNNINFSYEEAEDKLFTNALRKYNDLNKTSIQCSKKDVFECIEINPKPIAIKYKNIKFMGYKAKIYFKDNNFANAIGNILLVDGFGEKNSSVGAGFVDKYY